MNYIYKLNESPHKLIGLFYINNPDFIELDRKGKAQKILEIFPQCAWVAFSMLDKKELDPYKLWETFKWK